MSLNYAFGTTDRHSDTSKKNPQPLLGISKELIIQRIQAPQRVEKRMGSYVIPSVLHTRNFKAQREQGQYGFGWLDLDETAIPKPQLIEIIRTILPNHAFYIYSTASANGVDKFKWRILWFYTSLIETGALWSRFQEFINNHVEAQGIKPDRVNERSAQLCFLPNAPTEYYDYHIEPGADVNPNMWIDAGILPDPKPDRDPLDRVALAEENPNFDKLLDHVEVLDDEHPEGMLIECPWCEEHSGGGDSALLVAPGDTNGNKGGFRCLHHSHEGKNIGHVYSEYGLAPKFDAVAAFGTDAPELPQGSVPPVAVTSSIPPKVDVDVMQKAATLSLESMPEMCELISTLPVEAREAPTQRYSQNSGASVAEIRKGVKAVIARHRKEKQKQAIAARSVMGHELSRLNMTDAEGNINPAGFARIDGTNQLIASAKVDSLGNPRIGIRKYKDFHEWGMSQPKYYDEADDKMKCISEAWLEAGPVVHDVFDALTFIPGKPRIIETTTGIHKRSLNTYNPPVLHPVRNDALIQNFLSHIFEWLCSKDDQQYWYFIRWVAHLFQKPTEKPHIAVLFKGGIGIGKSEVVNAIGDILGSCYTTVLGPGALTPEYNDHLSSRLLIFADEFNESGMKNSARFRALVTGHRFNSHEKLKPIVELPCYLRVVAASNDDIVVDTKKGERRIAWMDCRTDMPGDPGTPERFKVCEPLYSDLRAEGFHSALYAYFLSVDLTGFNVKMPPDTEAKKEALNAGRDIVAKFIENCDETGSWYGTDLRVLYGQQIPKKMVQESFIAYCSSMRARPIDVRALGKRLLEFGIEVARVRDGTGDRIYVYQLPEVFDHV